MSQHLKEGSHQQERSRKRIDIKWWKGQKKSIIRKSSRQARQLRGSSRLPQPTRMDQKHNSMFESSTFYILDQMNSIEYSNDRIYNLLKVKPRSLWGRLLRCNCSKSKCEARYCQCFSHGQICTPDCNCCNCSNHNETRHEVATVTSSWQQNGCKCSKSGCLKNYCECFQRGQNCDDRCRCSNCGNSN